MPFVEKTTREVVDGIEYNVMYVKGNNATTIVYDPVRTPEQQKKREETLKRAFAEYCRAVIREKGEEWFCEHLAEKED